MIAGGYQFSIGVCQWSCNSSQLASGLSFQTINSDAMDFSDLMQQRAIPIEMIHERPPSIANYWNSFFAQTLNVARRKIKPLAAALILATTTRFGDHHRQAITFPIMTNSGVQAR